jgi:hypothetical protein
MGRGDARWADGGDAVFSHPIPIDIELTGVLRVTAETAPMRAVRAARAKCIVVVMKGGWMGMKVD